MSLADRKKAAEKEVAAKNKIPNGTYQVKLSDYEFGKSQKKHDMYTLTWKIIKPLELTGELPEGMEEKDLKGKKRKTRFMPGMGWSLAALLDILEQAGADLEAFEELSEIDDILEMIEDAGTLKATMTYDHPEDEQYPNIEISDVTKLLGEAEEEGEEEAADEPADEPEPGKKKKKRVRAPGSK